MEKELLFFISSFTRLLINGLDKNDDRDNLNRLYALRSFIDYLYKIGDYDLYSDLMNIYDKYLYKNKYYIDSIKDYDF